MGGDSIIFPEMEVEEMGVFGSADKVGMSVFFSEDRVLWAGF
jgi:hypothetical protein